MLQISTVSKSENQSMLSSLDEIARQGAKMMLETALEFEVADYVTRHKNARDEAGKALVVRNGYGKERGVTLGSGTVDVSAPRVNDKREGKKYTSNILPPYMRRSPNVESLLPVLYLKGLSTNDFRDALCNILGEGASGLSHGAISALKRSWEQDFQAWSKREIVQDYVYIWADGVNVKVRLGDDKKVCLLVIIGVNHAGQKHLLAVEAGYRESEESWAFVLRSLRERGLKAPSLAIGDGALGFWAAIASVFPETKEQRCWVHKIANALDKLPKRLQPRAKELLHEMMYSETLADAADARSRYEVAFAVKYEASVTCIVKDWDKLTTYFKFPAAHWVHLRTTNPIESTFATVKLRTTVTKGAGSEQAAKTMAFKLMQEAERRWNRIKGHEEIARVLSGVEYRDGIVVTGHEHREAVNA
jgi:transposase-like protein